MSRLQGHRKSQSTSALSALADGGHSRMDSSAGEGRRKNRASQHPSLGVVQEGDRERGSHRGNNPMASVPEPSSGKSEVQVEHMQLPSQKRQVERGPGEDELRGCLNDIMSLRSSPRRRITALRTLERALAMVCLADDQRRKGKARAGNDMMTLKAFVDLQVHHGLINLLTRHAQALTLSRSPTDITIIVNELFLLVGIIQGLCLLSRRCKEDMGESYVLEIIIDLLLLLRTQPPLSPSTPSTPSSAAPQSAESHSIVYSLLDLLCCILVDSPLHARTFERLSGLEAVVRVLKGTGVAKEIRMKCLEFLYFYLLPENSPSSSARAVSAASAGSASSSSSGESLLYPPSPLSSSTSSMGPASDGRISPSPLPHTHFAPQFTDLDIPFIPQTPKKPAQPSLGYLTPSTHHRRISGNLSITSTPSLAPVPASPRDDATTPSSRHRIPGTPSQEQRVAEREKERDNRRWSVMEPPPTPNPGLGLGIPKSSSVSTNLHLAAMAPEPISGLPIAGLKRDVTAIRLDRQLTEEPLAMGGRPNFTDPFGESRNSSSGSSTVVPSRHSSGMSRSSTQPSLSIISSSTASTSGIQRRVSARRPSKSPLVQMSPAAPAQLPRTDSSMHISSRRESLAVPTTTATTSTLASSSTSASASHGPKAPKIRHSRTQSHLSGLAGLPSQASSIPALPRVPSIHRPSSNTTIPSSPSSRRGRERERDQVKEIDAAKTTPQPTPAKRAFPAELTKGLPPSASSPALNSLGTPKMTTPVPLGASRRIPSEGKRLSVADLRGNAQERRQSRDGEVKEGEKREREKEKVKLGKEVKEVKSVEEKKELLSSWLGNVDALVQGVEKVSFWSSVQKGRRG